MPTIKYPVQLQFFSQEKTEKATPRKKLDARKKGQVAKSQELPSAFIILFVFLLLWLFGGVMSGHMMDMFRKSFSEYLLWELSPQTADIIFKQMTMEAVKLVLPVLLLAMVAAFFANYIQIGFLFTTDPLKMKLEKLNPIQGAKRIFSLRSIVELVKSILKITIVSSVAIFILWGARNEWLLLSNKTVGSAIQFFSSTLLKLGIVVSLLLVILAIFDYMYQKYDHEKQLRMSKQDIKDEYKKTEGDPLIKGKIKEKQRQMAMSRMMSEIPKADVVITNPTHFAVAIMYDSESMDAPMVIAKGQDFIALKIKEKAKEYRIMTMENKLLARALYANAEIGDEVPEDLFQAVAEVLAYVYRMKGKV